MVKKIFYLSIFSDILNLIIKNIRKIYGGHMDNRSEKDRRDGIDRRKQNNKNYNGPERRSDTERRLGKDRRAMKTGG